MTQYRNWLPEEVFRSDHACLQVVRVVREWSAQWMAGATWQPAGSWTAADITLGDDWTPLRQSQDISILGNATSILTLARAILGTGEGATNAHDLKLMRRLAGDALDDLTSRLQANGFASDDTPLASATDPEWVIAIHGGGGETVLKLLCSQDCLTAMARKTFRRSRLPALTLPPSAGLDAVETEIGALIGRARLSVDSLLTLEVGDVVVLDRPSSDPLEMIASGRPTGLRGTLSEHHGQLALELQDVT